MYNLLIVLNKHDFQFTDRNEPTKIKLLFYTIRKTETSK